MISAQGWQALGAGAAKETSSTESDKTASPQSLGQITKGSPEEGVLPKEVFCSTPVQDFPDSKTIVGTPVRREQGSDGETLGRENPERGSRPGFLSYRSY
jgi:hypothetical protein